ncbi:hypothetical protein [Desulfofalx alkaliphila]|uniref:hypothetical protein n=1 Tax=Desulfofalx alkaliphila TaxID=105483 RepID=UPI0004E21F04|nr:hypothetical protein [Desulfofalx alkaliphila]
MVKRAKREQQRQEVLQYCIDNTHLFNAMTTVEIIRHIKQKYPKVAEKDPHLIVDALGKWCVENRPGIAG